MNSTVTLRVIPDGTVTVPAFDLGVPGLAITRGLDPHLRPTDHWVVTHRRSGLSVMVFDDPESAAACVQRIGSLTDWTVSASELEAIFPSIRWEFSEIKADLKGRFAGPARHQCPDLAS